MSIDTHAAFRELENGGFNADQAETLVRVINGAAGEQATKGDIKDLRDDSERLRDEFKDLRNDFKELRDEFKDQYATKAELKTEVAKLEAKIEAATNRVLLGVLVIAGVQLAAFSLLLAALKFWP